jgi:hypothetical protein
MMGLIHDAAVNHPNKRKMVVPPNCYGGTNDQARRAEALTNVEIVDLLVDGDNDMVKSIDTVLAQIALEDAILILLLRFQPIQSRSTQPNRS